MWGFVLTGDYRDRTVVVWSTYDYSVLTQSTASQPIHEVRWDPYAANEFASVGAGGNLLFWLLDETSPNISLNVHEARVPSELLRSHVNVSALAVCFSLFSLPARSKVRYCERGKA